MAYTGETLPIGINLDWVSTPRFKTHIVTADNGYESRIRVWAGGINKLIARYDVRKQADWRRVDELFQICKGRGHTFRFRDPRHYIATSGQGVFVGGQATLRITVGSNTVDKTITKLDATTIITGGTVNINTGAATGGNPSAFTGLFWLCGRFGVDELEISGIDKRADGTFICAYKDVPIFEVPFE